MVPATSSRTSSARLPSAQTMTSLIIKALQIEKGHTVPRSCVDKCDSINRFAGGLLSLTTVNIAVEPGFSPIAIDTHLPNKRRWLTLFFQRTNPKTLDSRQGVENGFAYCFSSPNGRAIVLAHGPPGCERRGQMRGSSIRGA